MNTDSEKNIEINVKVKGYQILDKRVQQGTRNGGRIYVPISWLGKQVKVILVEPLDSEEK